MNPGFWNGKRVLLTGHTGFKGSWLAIWLEALGAEVTGFALDAPTTPNLFEVAAAGRSLRDLRGDLRDLGAVEHAVATCNPEVVIHLAAQSLVRPSYVSPIETFATNVMGTAHVLDAVRRAPLVRSVVVVTTDKCYENREWVWGYREQDPMGGYDPYAASKGCAELVTQSYRRSYFRGTTAVATARAGNVIGGGDWALDRLIPDLMRAATRGERASIRNPGSTRPWQHVLEPLSGYLMLAERLYVEGQAFADAWNFGPPDAAAQPVRWVAQTLTTLWDAVQWEVEGADGQPHEAQYLKLDCSKARAQLGWGTRLTLTDALRWTAEWHHAFAQGFDMPTMTREQIDRYVQLEAA